MAKAAAATTQTPREAAEQRLRELEGEVARVKAELSECRRFAEESGVAMNAAADLREDLLARGDVQGAEEARARAAEAAGQLNLATARLRGLARLLEEHEAALPAVAVEVGTFLLAEYERALATAREQLDVRGVSEADVANYVDAFREGYALRQELFRCTADLRHAPGTFDLKPELERRSLLGLAPEWVQYRHGAKPALREEWRAPLAAHLERYRAQRETRLASERAAAGARRAAAPADMRGGAA